MFSIPSLRLPSFGFGAAVPKADIPSVTIHDVETAAEKRPRTLKHLIRANHANHSIIYHELRFHNHTPHILGSAYIFGATAEHLNDIYDKEAEELEPWTDSPSEIAKHDWRDFLGKREYQRAFIDFFEDQLVQYSYDWKAELKDFLFEGENPLINNLISGLGHPLIHLGYAYELRSRTLAIEALALTSCFYDFQHLYLDDPEYSRPSDFQTRSLTEILQRVHDDDRFNNLFETPGGDNLERLFKEREDAVLEHWNSWDLTGKNLEEQFMEGQKVAVALLLARQGGSTTEKYDFFVVHLLNTSHAVRVLLPLIPAKWHVPLLRQWALFVISAYVAQLRPALDFKRIEDFDLQGKDWKDVQHLALKGGYNLDAHYVKALRSMQEAEKTWPNVAEGYYLKAAVKFATEFDGWGGFGSAMSEEEVRAHARGG
ncbi:uncharacterized protein K452DRAFT_314839 [Aplosporella prunicola CBS 121167]|uniref:Apoptosis regulator Bcl-2 family BH4 domain-containing protein n=1 Tax=Aplosporella prunicola CBS 121167 TaxID=1176127 RepID=A0A6A6BR53_9PEZI|nr:uncharacterized protein K452DRAFT_314839 [Aplosporella prunicola CBS 121167]KAF2146589.1 hypothetical protein K452DRAFT_314839 [Aplosporella prunicola CBS 121167]